MDFEDYMTTTGMDEQTENSCAWKFYKELYRVGQQSKQAEIDALEEKLKKLEDHTFINYDDERDDDQHSYWSGYNVALGEIAAIIEENNNDT